MSLKWSGGLGGHNGLRSTKANLGTQDFWRLRFGIGRPNHDDISGYVLSDFTKDERIILSQIFVKAEELLNKLKSEDPNKLLDKYKKVSV
jgi:PTH1 family peptidyl-tRNA hydrolase